MLKAEGSLVCVRPPFIFVLSKANLKKSTLYILGVKVRNMKMDFNTGARYPKKIKILPIFQSFSRQKVITHVAEPH